MLTNIFRIGGLQQVSWFQLLPAEAETGQQIGKSKRPSAKLDNVADKVLAAHLRLQYEGHLSTLRPDFIGPSEDASCPVQEVQLWLFLPGRHDCIGAALQCLVADFKVARNGIWCPPGADDKVTIALCQALHNRIEWALKGVGYTRFGEVFVKCRSFGAIESQLRKSLSTFEVIFTANVEAIFAHFIIQRKRIRILSIQDMYATSMSDFKRSIPVDNRIKVVLAPNGLTGVLNGCYSGDLVNELYQSKLKVSSNKVPNGVAFQMISSAYSGNSSLQTVFPEVYIGQHAFDKRSAIFRETSCSNRSGGAVFEQSLMRSKLLGSAKVESLPLEQNEALEKMLIYPAEMVLVPLTPVLPAKTYLRRCWLQDWCGSTWLEGNIHIGVAVDTSTSSLFCEQMHKVSEMPIDERLKSLAPTPNGLHDSKSFSKSSSTGSSSGSSIKSSSTQDSSSSSDSDAGGGIGPGELDADADSLASKGNALASKSGNLPLIQSVKEKMDELTGFEDMTLSSKHGHLLATASQSEGPKPKIQRTSNSLGGELSNDVLKSMQNRADFNVSAVGISSNLGTSTPRAAANQLEIPWDWPEDERGLAIDMQNDADILAEFGDFREFFEDDGFGFGEPPGTAESEAFLFSLAECGGVSSPSTACLDFSDQMLLPILDIPVLEGFGQQTASGKDIKLQGNEEEQKDLLHSVQSPTCPSSSEVLPVENESLPRMESLLLFAPAYVPVSIPNCLGTSGNLSVPKSSYVPESRKRQVGSSTSEIYVYNANPPPSPKDQYSGKKQEHYRSTSISGLGKNKRFKSPSKDNYISSLGTAITVFGGYGTSTGRNNHASNSVWSHMDSLVAGKSGYLGKILDKKLPSSGRGLTAVLATDLECFVLQSSFMCFRKNQLFKPLARSNVSNGKDNRIYMNNDGNLAANLSGKINKSLNASRIAGKVDGDQHGGAAGVQVGVWRPVAASRSQNPANSVWSECSRPSSLPLPKDHSSSSLEEAASVNPKQKRWKELIDALPLLVQQSTVYFDTTLDGDCGDGPFGWLAHDQQGRRKHVCGPWMTHAECGGMLSAAHSIDDSGVELLDPLASEVSASSVVSLLQSDVRMVMATAFADLNSDGPLSLIEWAKGHVLVSDSNIADNIPSDSKETASTVTIAVGEPITPPQCPAATPLGLKVQPQDLEARACETQRTGSCWGVEGAPFSDDSISRHTNQDAAAQDLDLLSSNRQMGPSLVALPMPSLLVGYQDDWLKTSPSTLHFWEKAPFEPYASPKPVIYNVICPRIDSLLLATADYIQQLSTMYDACKLGTHFPASAASGEEVLMSSTGKCMLRGFLPVDFPSATLNERSSVNPFGSNNDFVETMKKSWSTHEFCNALYKACRQLPVLAGNPSQRDPENGPSLVYYVICPSSEPIAILKTMLVASQCLGSSSTASDKNRKPTSTLIQKEGDLSSSISSIMGFSIPKLVLQILTAENIFKMTSPSAMGTDSLRELAFTIYNKIRRIPRTSINDFHQQLSQSVRNQTVSSQMGNSIASLWKDFGTSRGGGMSTPLLPQDALIDSSFHGNCWETSWQQHTGPATDANSQYGAEGQTSLLTRYLFEPLFILAEPGNLEQGIGISPFRNAGMAEVASSGQVGVTETIANENSEFEISGSGNQKDSNLHCSYGWTEDWHWLVSVWTDACGELLDVQLFPTANIRNCWDGKGLQSIFMQILHHGCQLLAMATGIGSIRPRNMVISRLGSFYELELYEWQKAAFAVGGNEIRRWPVQIWQHAVEGSPFGSTSDFQHQDISSFTEKASYITTSGPSSPSPSSTFFNLQNRTSNFAKSELGVSTRKPGNGGQPQAELPKGFPQLFQSITFVTVSLDHSLQLTSPCDATAQSGSASIFSAPWLASNNTNLFPPMGTGLGLVKTLATTPLSYLIIPAHGLRYMPASPLQLPSYVTSESPAIAQLLDRKGFVPPLTSAFVVSKATPTVRIHLTQQNLKEEWPSTLYIGLVGYVARCTNINKIQGSETTSKSETTGKVKISKSMHHETREQISEAHYALELATVELQALSWLTCSPRFPSRRTALPFHCDLLQRLCRVINFADSEFNIGAEFEENRQECV